MAYKVMRTSEGTLNSKGKEFINGKSMVVTKELYNYLKKTFPNDFKFEETKEKAVKTTRKSAKDD